MFFQYLRGSRSSKVRPTVQPPLTRHWPIKGTDSSSDPHCCSLDMTRKFSNHYAKEAVELTSVVWIYRVYSETIWNDKEISVRVHAFQKQRQVSEKKHGKHIASPACANLFFPFTLLSEIFQRSEVVGEIAVQVPGSMQSWAVLGTSLNLTFFTGLLHKKKRRELRDAECHESGRLLL